MIFAEEVTEFRAFVNEFLRERIDIPDHILAALYEIIWSNMHFLMKQLVSASVIGQWASTDLSDEDTDTALNVSDVFDLLIDLIDGLGFKDYPTMKEYFKQQGEKINEMAEEFMKMTPAQQQDEILKIKRRLMLNRRLGENDIRN